MDKLPEKYEDLPPTPAELMERTNRLVTENNETRERLRIARDNRRRGHDEPRGGDVLFVSLDRTIEARRRAGVRFERGHRSKVLVVDAPDDVVAKLQEAGNLPDEADGVVNIYGAERILEDDALIVHQSMGAGDGQELVALRRERDAAAAEAARLREENAALRSARQSAPVSTTGSPNRLNAAREVAAKAGKGDSKAGEEFGGDPEKK